MTTRKKPARRRPTRPSDDEGTSITFSSLVKWFVGVAGTVVAAALIAAFSWLWTTNSEQTRISAKVEVNADSIAAMATLPIAMATMQQQMINLQTTQSNANIALADRMNKLEQENRWRDRAGSGGGFQRR